MDWQWFASNFPTKCKEMEQLVAQVPQQVVMPLDGRIHTLCIGASKWGCVSIGVNYYAAPHTDPNDLGGAAVRFVDVGRGEIVGNEFVLPELGVVLETPSMSVLWAQTDRVCHGTMRAQPREGSGAVQRVASARQLKKTLHSWLGRQQQERAEGAPAHAQAEERLG